MKDVRDQWQTYRLSKPYNAGAAHPAALTTCLIELFSARETVSGLFCKFLLLEQHHTDPLAPLHI